MKKVKSIYELTPGWLMHRLTMKQTQKDLELFDQICVLVSRRLQEKKRLYKKPFPDGEYKLYVSLQKTTFDGVIYKQKHEDIFVVSGSRKGVAVFTIEISGNNIEFKDLESKSSKFSSLTCKEISIVVLQQMGFKILN